MYVYDGAMAHVMCVVNSQAIDQFWDILEHAGTCWNILEYAF
jgi:hypothetical protein